MFLKPFTLQMINNSNVPRQMIMFILRLVYFAFEI